MTHTRTLQEQVPYDRRIKASMPYGDICGEFSFIGYQHVPTDLLWPLLETADMEGTERTAHEIREELKRRQARGERLW